MGDAFRLGVDNTPDWFMATNKARIIDILKCIVEVYTLNGTKTASAGDFIIKDARGELYVCKAKKLNEL